MASEKSMLEHIDELIAEEKLLRSSSHSHTGADRERLQQLEVQLDQTWDLLRQRRAKAEFDQDPEDVKERPASEVENYRQ